MCWSGPCGGCGTLLEDLQSAAVQLGAVQAQTHGLRAAVDQLSPATFGAHALSFGVTLLEQRMQATADLCQHQQHHWQRPHIDPPSPAAAVFSNRYTCKAILACLGRGYWFFLAGTSKTLRGTYMATLAEGCNGEWLCKTSVYAASLSLSAFDLACRSGLSHSDALKCATAGNAIVETGNDELVLRALDAGMAVSEAMLHTLRSEAAVAHVVRTCPVCKSRTPRPTRRAPVAASRRQQAFGSADDRSDYDVDMECVYLYNMCYERSVEDADRHTTELNILDTAASRGHQHIVAYLRSQAHAYTKHTALEAAFRGHFALLKWLHMQADCPFEVPEVVRVTMMSKTASPEQLAWLLELQGQS
ncbi:hypothetical protein JKP88DRAFT_250898 [Tribonema minus]|uniref:Uncharacterized protein n=1 Tax=Tribonema minus TaxID=303371 RepID=A0A835ZPD8_9STRA|nr:hypothetical protein JKP88DRAFT_250898 [Tribonema minus]